MIVIYHNPECEDSKECLEILETSKHNNRTIKYIKHPLEREKLSKIISLLNINPEELIRKDSKIWKKLIEPLIESGHKFTNEEYILIMVENQDLVERPIIINGEKVIIGKPAKKMLDIIT